MRKSLNDIAIEKYGAPFHHLSAFGQREVLVEWNGSDEITMRHVDLAQALSEAQQKIAKLERENKDLWEDNEELQMRLYDYEDSPDGNAGQRQGRTRIRTNESISSVSTEASGPSDRTDTDELLSW